MRQRMTDEHRLHRGNRAREVLENEEFEAAFTAIEEDLIESWQNIPSTSSESHVAARERIHLSLTMLRKVRAAITQTMETGKLAAEELKYKRSMSERVKEWAGMN